MMQTVVNEKNQVVNEEGLPFFDPVEALPPGDPRAVPRSNGLVLPFVRSEKDRQRTKEERARWMDSVFSQLEDAEAEELAREEAELDSKQGGELERIKTEDGEDDDQDTSLPPIVSHSPASSSKAGSSSPGSAAKFSGLQRGFLNSKPKTPAKVAPSGALKGRDVQCAVSDQLQVRERTIQPQSPASVSPASTSAVTDKAAPKAPVIGSALPASPAQDTASTSSTPKVSSRLRFEDLTIADEDEHDDGDEAELDDDDEDEIDEDDEDEGFTIEDWDSDDDGYDSDDLRDLAPDLDAEIDNAELAREYARARAGLLQSRALDEARREHTPQERHGGEDIVPLDASISDPSARSTASTPRVSRFRASRLARAVNDFDTLLHSSKTGERNPLLLVPDLAPVRYPKKGDVIDPSVPGLVVDNVDLEGESDEEEERLHEVMKARLAALEDREELAGVSKKVVERGTETTAGGRQKTIILPPVVERTELVQEAAGPTSTAGPDEEEPKPIRKSTIVEPKEKPLSDPGVPHVPQPPQPAPVKEVRFAVDEKEGSDAPSPAAAVEGASEAPAAPKVSRFKARKMAERGLS
ncbi:unnamed protein product [Tilletia caries]|nr:hypothetical protein CF335_g25 [Tilletia laevis]CAD6960745.1 unnamed protein product [Tilletia caries]